MNTVYADPTCCSINKLVIRNMLVLPTLFLFVVVKLVLKSILSSIKLVQKYIIACQIKVTPQHTVISFKTSDILTPPALCLEAVEPISTTSDLVVKRGVKSRRQWRLPIAPTVLSFVNYTNVSQLI